MMGGVILFGEKITNTYVFVPADARTTTINKLV